MQELGKRRREACNQGVKRSAGQDDREKGAFTEGDNVGHSVECENVSVPVSEGVSRIRNLRGEIGAEAPE